MKGQSEEPFEKYSLNIHDAHGSQALSDADTASFGRDSQNIPDNTYYDEAVEEELLRNTRFNAKKGREERIDTSISGYMLTQIDDEEKKEKSLSLRTMTFIEYDDPNINFAEIEKPALILYNFR